jgi:hypothetical protein
MSDLLTIKVPFSGFYESTHDAVFDSWLEYEVEVRRDDGATEEEIEKLQDLYFKSIDWKVAHELYAKEYVSLVSQFIKKEDGKDIELVFEELTSPRYYNFETDRIFAKISFTDIEYMSDMIDSEALKERVKETYTSYDGFSSFYPNDISKWPADIRAWDHNQLEIILELYLEHISQKELNEILNWGLIEDITCNGEIDEIIYSAATPKFTEYSNSLWSKYNDKDNTSS